MQTPNLDDDLRSGFRLEYATLTWNVVGSVVLGCAAFQARSTGLAGFGLDSLIEIFASVVVVWQLKGGREAHERTAMRLIGTAFFALAIYIAVQAVFSYLVAIRPAPSPLGMAWLVITVVAMALLARGKGAVGRRLNNPVLTAEAQVTLIDAALAFAVLVGVGVNTVFGWWWADPLSGLVIIGYALREGMSAWHH